MAEMLEGVSLVGGTQVVETWVAYEEVDREEKRVAAAVGQAVVGLQEEDSEEQMVGSEVCTA